MKWYDQSRNWFNQLGQFYIITHSKVDFLLIIHYLTYLIFLVNFYNQLFESTFWMDFLNQLFESTFWINLCN